MKKIVDAISGELSRDEDAIDVARRALEAAGVPVARFATILERDGAGIPAAVVHGSRAAEAWRALRDAVPRSGRWPVVLGDEAAIALLRGPIEHGSVPSVGEVLRRADAIDAERALGEHRAQHAESGAPEPHEPWDAEDEALEEERAAAESEVRAGRDVLSGEPLPEVAIALLPTRDGAEAAAWLGFGGWNECPEPAEHVAVMRRWGARFGAELVSIGPDTVEARVQARPRDLDAARALAEEQYAYAPDIVDQGTGSLERLAAALATSQLWYFWWD